MITNLATTTTSLIQELTFLLDYSVSIEIFSDRLNQRLEELNQSIDQTENQEQKIYTKGIYDGIAFVLNDLNKIYSNTLSTYFIENNNDSNSNVTNNNDSN